MCWWSFILNKLIDFKYYGHPPPVKTTFVACFIKKYVEVKNKYITLLTESYSQNPPPQSNIELNFH